MLIAASSSSVSGSSTGSSSSSWCATMRMTPYSNDRAGATSDRLLAEPPHRSMGILAKEAGDGQQARPTLGGGVMYA